MLEGAGGQYSIMKCTMKTAEVGTVYLDTSRSTGRLVIHRTDANLTKWYALYRLYLMEFLSKNDISSIFFSSKQKKAEKKDGIAVEAELHMCSAQEVRKNI